jgi:O-antigen/teichoic acid export membrane protein
LQKLANLTLDNTIRVNLFWDYVNRFGNLIVTLITSTILARLLSPADYGLVGIAFAVNGLAGIFLNIGFASAIIQLKELDDRVLSTVFFLNIGIAVIIYLSIFISANRISEFYKILELALILKVASVIFIINALNIIPSALLTRAMKFKQIAIVSLINSFISGILGVYFALNNYGVWSIVFQQIVGSVITLVCFFYLTKWSPILYYRISKIKGMMRFGFFMFFSGVLDGIYTRIDIFLIAKVFNPTALGLYSRAQNLDGMIRSMSAGSILNVLFPTFAKIRDEKEQLKRFFYDYFQIICFTFCFLAGFFYIFSEQLFFLLFGSNWNISAVYFKILILAGFAYPLSTLSLSIIEARGNSRNFFVVEVIKKILLCPTYFIAYFYGIIPFLMSYVVICAISTFINVRFLKFELDISVLRTMRFLGFYFSCSAFLVLFLNLTFNKFNMEENLVNTIIKLFMFILCYYLVNKLTKSNGMVFLFDLILDKNRRTENYITK